MNHDSPKRLFGLGLGRTGTKSLCRAAEILGYAPVLHNPPFFHQLRRAGAATGEVVVMHYQYLKERFPEASFVLTTRPLPEWLASSRAAMEHYPLDRIDTSSVYYDCMVRNRLTRWGCLQWDRDRMELHWQIHHATMLDHFGDRLLIFNVAQGWKHLCKYLGVEIPAVPFPHENRLR